MRKVFILHGWAYTTEKWDPFIKSLKEKGFNVKLLKIPGLTEKLTGTWDINNYVQWLKENIAKDEKIILIGHSNGGRIILAFAHKYPKKVKHLVLIDSAGIYHNELPIRLKRFTLKAISAVGKKFTGSKALRNLLYKIAGEKDYRDAPPKVRETLANLIKYDASAILPKIKIPTLIIWGEQDKVTPPSDGKLFHKLIKGSKLITVASARHSPQFTHVNEVTQIIQRELT